MLAGACCRSRRSSMALMPMETERPNDPIRADRKSAIEAFSNAIIDLPHGWNLPRGQIECGGFSLVTPIWRSVHRFLDA